MTRTLSLT